MARMPFGWGSEAQPPSEAPTATDPVDRLFDAVKAVNAAWDQMPRDVSLWIDWKNRRVTIQTKRMDVENHSRESLRDELEKRQAPY